MVMRHWRKFLLLACLVPAAAWSTGCGSDRDDDDDAPDGDGSTNGPSLTGSWSGSYSSGVTFTMDLVQTDDAVTGTYALDSGSSGTVAGSVSGDEVALTISVAAPAAAADFTGTVNEERTAMGGRYLIIDGGGGSGTWSANK